MTRYLKHVGDEPFTAADIAAELGLDAALFGAVIDATIAATCASMSGVRTTVWTIPLGSVDAMPNGEEPVRIGEPYQQDGQYWRDCTFGANPASVAAARRKVIARLQTTADFARRRA